MMQPIVLIAEGDAELCQVYQRFLSARGYRAETATNGLECLAKLQQQTPAAVVLDLNLRWGGGDGVVAWLRERATHAGIPVIVTATAIDPADGDEFVEPPVVQFLRKPFGLPALLQSVHSAVATGPVTAADELEVVRSR